MAAGRWLLLLAGAVVLAGWDIEVTEDGSPTVIFTRDPAATARKALRIDFAAQDDYGVEMARMDLWREAMFRFKRAVAIDPGDALAHNNLAVAYEANGDFELAGKEYREALRLGRSNSYIQKNFSRYTEFQARAKKRPSPQPGASTPAKAAHPEPVAPPSPPQVPDSAPPPAPPPAVPPGGAR